MVIGGGITGLAAAHRLTELVPHAKIVLLESAPRLGGVLRTQRRNGYLLEHSADNFITNVPWGVDLCRRVGLADKLLQTCEQHRRALVARNGKLFPVPSGFELMAPTRLWPMLGSPILSVAGRLRVACEPFIPRRRDQADESLAAFVRRRLGREAFERLVQPLVGGIYTADPETLSLRATLPRFVEMEVRHGSLMRAAWAARHARRGSAGNAQVHGVRYGLFVAPKEGMGSLVDAVAARLPEGTVKLNATALRLTGSAAGGWTVVVRLGEQVEELSADGVILATPAPASAGLLAEVDPELGRELAGIEYAGCAVVLLGYRLAQFARPPDGFGFVVPEIEGRQILAASYSSQKYAGRAPDGKVLLRAFVGGAGRREVVHWSDDRLREVVTRELSELPGVKGEPELFEVSRWGGHMPQYKVGHLERVARIEARASTLPRLALAGSAYRGVGVPHCIHSGEQAAERLVASLAT